MTKQRYRIGREEIAALEIVCDPNTRFSHKLELSNIECKWVLRKKKQKKNNGSQAPSPARSGTPDVSRISKVDEGEEGEERGAVLAHQEMGAISPVLDDEKRTKKEEQSQKRPGTAASSSSVANSSTRRHSRLSVTRSDQDRYEPTTFCEKPLDLKTLRTLDISNPVTEPTEILISSPRSAFLILQGGLSVKQLCAVDNQAFFNQGLIEGATVETVQLRIKNENQRRRAKYEQLLRDYVDICEDTSLDELVEAIRLHKHGFSAERQQNIEQLQSVEQLAHTGKLDITVLDADCIDVLHKSRSRTLGEIRRVLDQRDRMLHRNIEREKSVFEREKLQVEETLRVQRCHEEDRQQKSEEFKLKNKRVKEKVEKLLDEQDEMTNQQRKAIVDKRNAVETRVKERKELDKTAIKAIIETREERRKKVKEMQEAMLESKREQLVTKTEFANKVHEREMQKRQETLQHRKEKFQQLVVQRRKAIKEMAELAQERRVQKVEDSIREAEERAQEFQHMKRLRLAKKHERAKEKAARGAFTRSTAEQIKEERLLDLKEEYNEKLNFIEEAKMETRDELSVRKELSTQQRQEKVDEQKRSVSAMEFKYVGYVCSNLSKTQWMEREHEKRKTLSTFVRQEREAMMRARDRVLFEIDEDEIARKKKDSHERSKNGIFVS